MNNNARHSRWFRSMVAMLLCGVLCCIGAHAIEDVSAQTAETLTPVHKTYSPTQASLDEKEDGTLHTVHEMGEWGLPATSTNLQGAISRTLTPRQMSHRITRLYNACLGRDPLNIHKQAKALCRTISSKRFHYGYYTHFRCQMRC